VVNPCYDKYLPTSPGIGDQIQVGSVVVVDYVEREICVLEHCIATGPWFKRVVECRLKRGQLFNHFR